MCVFYDWSQANLEMALPIDKLSHQILTEFPSIPSITTSKKASHLKLYSTTTLIVKYVPSRLDHNEKIVCKAINHAFPVNESIELRNKLDIHCKLNDLFFGSLSGSGPVSFDSFQILFSSFSFLFSLWPGSEPAALSSFL